MPPCTSKMTADTKTLGRDEGKTAQQAALSNGRGRERLALGSERSGSRFALHRPQALHDLRHLRPVDILRIHCTKNPESACVGGSNSFRGNPPLAILNLRESNTLKLIFLVHGLAVSRLFRRPARESPKPQGSHASDSMLLNEEPIFTGEFYHSDSDHPDSERPEQAKTTNCWSQDALLASGVLLSGWSESG